MTATQHEPTTVARPATPTWRAVARSTLRTHRTEFVVPALTVLFVIVFAVVGYALTRYGIGT